MAAIAELLKERILIIDGAMGTMIQAHRLQEADYRGTRFAGHPRDLKGWLMVGETMQAAKMWDLALEAYQEAAKLAAQADRHSRLRVGQGLRGVGRGLWDQSKYAECELPYREAARWLEQAIAETPGGGDTNRLSNDLASATTPGPGDHRGLRARAPTSSVRTDPRSR